MTTTPLSDCGADSIINLLIKTQNAIWTLQLAPKTNAVSDIFTCSLFLVSGKAAVFVFVGGRWDIPNVCTEQVWSSLPSPAAAVG